MNIINVDLHLKEQVHKITLTFTNDQIVIQSHLPFILTLFEVLT